MTQGYVLIASNDPHYLEMAVSAACSLKVNDTKPVALLISGGMKVPTRYAALFDWIVAFDPPAPFDGDFLRRFVLETYTPFTKAMHIDADCFLIRKDIDRFWNAFDGKAFGVTATLSKNGKCYRDQTDVDNIIAEGIAPGVYVTNWGVFYYQNTGDNKVMALGRDLIRKHLSETDPEIMTYFSRPGQLSDEPIWGIALAQHDEPVMPFDPDDMLQVTSPSTSDHDFDYENGDFSVRKGGRPHKGQIYHFAAMNPLDGYLEGVRFFRRAMGVPLPSLRGADGEVLDAAAWADDIDAILPRLRSAQDKPDFQFITP